MARYGNKNTLNYLLDKFVQETDSKKEKFYATILDCIYKFGFGRLMSLAISKRERILKRYKELPRKPRMLASGMNWQNNLKNT